jgi:MFS family permease
MKDRSFSGYAITAAGFSIWFIGWGTFTPCFSVFLKPLLTEFNWSRADASIAYALAFLVQAVSALFMGWLTDRFGPRFVVMSFGSLLGLCYLLMTWVDSLWQFQLNFGLLAGIGSSTITVPVMATLSRWFDRKRNLMIGIVQAGMGAGGMIFPPLAGWLIIRYGWRTAYFVLGVTTLAGMVTAGSFLKRDPGEAGQVPDGVTSPEKPRAVEQDRASSNGGFTLARAFQTREFWIIAGLFLTFGFCRSAFTAHITAHVQDLGFTLADGANILAVIVGASMFGRVGMGRLADMIGNKPSFIFSFALTTVSLIIGLAAKDLWLLYVFAFLFGAAWGNQAVLRFSLPSEVFGVASLGVLLGALGMAESGAATFGSYYAGHIFDVFGTYSPVFWIGIGASLAGTLLAAMLKPSRRRG